VKLKKGKSSLDEFEGGFQDGITLLAGIEKEERTNRLEYKKEKTLKKRLMGREWGL